MNNMTDKEKQSYRRAQNALMLGGQGIIMFCVWTVVKMLLLLTVDRAYFDEMLYTSTANPSDIIYAIVVVFVVAILAVDITIRSRIGLSAMRVAKGGRLGKADLVLTILYLAVSAFLLCSYSGLISDARVFEKISEIVIDVISLAIIIIILYSAVIVRRFRKQYNIN